MDPGACLDENQILDLLEGRLSPEAVGRIQRHADGCAECYTLLTRAAVVHGTDDTPSFRAEAHTGPSSGGDPPALEAGQHLGQYVIIRKIGQGGMGTVYEALHRRVGHRAAIKVLHGRHATRKESAGRLLTEARAANLVQHPSLVRVFDDGYLPQGAPYLAMEYVEGQPLSHHLHRLAGAARLALLPFLYQAADALAGCHDRGIVHRDLKPDNLMVVRDPVVPGGERIKILDFGLAKMLSEDGEGPRTRTGVIMGTPIYMAPEQCRESGQVDSLADVYSLGVLLFEILSGRPPFQSRDMGELIAMHLRDEPPPLSTIAPDAPAELSDLAHRMLRKEPGDRPTMKQVAERLLAFSVGRTRPAEGASARQPVRRRVLLPVAGSALALLVAGALALVARTAWHRRSVIPRPGMVRVPGGTFRMGSSPNEVEAAYLYCGQLAGEPCERDQFERERPERTITVSSFYLDATEETNERFAAWLNTLGGLRVRDGRWVEEGAGLLYDLYPNYIPTPPGIRYRDGRFVSVPGFERRPATQMTWGAARRYCTAQGKRLPTEAEWEFAARGAEDTRFPWGFDEPRCEGVVHARDTGQGCAHLLHQPREVGTAPQDRTPLQIFDLGGNVSEWVEDAFQERYAPCAGQACTDPRVDGPDSGETYRVVRGGNFEWSAAAGRAASRSRWKQRDPTTNFGFRCAR